MKKKITEKEITNLVNDFRSGILINNLVKSYGYTKATINKYLKKNINENEYKLLTKAQPKNSQLDKANLIINNQESSNLQTDFSLNSNYFPKLRFNFAIVIDLYMILSDFMKSII